MERVAYDGDVKWIPTSAARKLLGVSRQMVYQLIETGSLVSVKCDHTVLVSQRSVEARIALLRAEGEGEYAGR